MKKKLLPLAVLAGMVGAAGTAEAVYLNQGGLGETLIYPYYSVEGGQTTLVSIVNTTDLTKAVKVRFIEAMNSAEVLDFNLYLSPYDHWAGAISRTDDGAMLTTADNSCTVPAIPADGVPFRNFQYGIEGALDGGPTGLERTREGYVEVIEMGVIDDLEVVSAGGPFGAEAAILHAATGVPANCDLLVAAWLANGVNNSDGITGTGEWDIAPERNFLQDTDLLGGLYGYGILMNVAEGTNATYSATALDSFFAITPQHTNPGFVSPSLGSAFGVATIIDGDTTVDLDYTLGGDGWDAVSALFMHDTISNDYIMEPTISAGTDWVISMPTKREYVFLNPDTVTEARAPFTNAWVDGSACEEIQPTYWDREEQVPGTPIATGDVDFSPRPPAVIITIEGFALCSEVNVISFLDSDVDTDDAALPGYVSAVYPSVNIQYGLQLEENFVNGWARIAMATNNDATETRILRDDNGVELIGLPTVGFAVQKFANDELGGVGGSAAFYSGLVEHKYTRNFN